MKNKKQTLMEILKEQLKEAEYKMLLDYYQTDEEIEKAIIRNWEIIMIKRLNLFK